MYQLCARFEGCTQLMTRYCTYISTYLLYRCTCRSNTIGKPWINLNHLHFTTILQKLPWPLSDFGTLDQGITFHLRPLMSLWRLSIQCQYKMLMGSSAQGGFSWYIIKRPSCLYFCVVCLLFLVLFIKNMHIQQAPKSTSTHVEFISFLYSKHPYKQYKINLYKLMSFTQFLPPFDLSRCPFPVLIVSFSLLVAVPAL